VVEHRLLTLTVSAPSRVPVDLDGDHPADRVAGLTRRRDPAVGGRCTVSEHGAGCHLGSGRLMLSRAPVVPHRCERGGPRGTSIVGRRAGRVATRRWPHRSGRSPARPRGRASRRCHPLRRVPPPPRRYSTAVAQRTASQPSARWLTPRGVRPMCCRHVPGSTSAGRSPPPPLSCSCTKLLGVRPGIRSPFPTGSSKLRRANRRCL